MLGWSIASWLTGSIEIKAIYRKELNCIYHLLSTSLTWTKHNPYAANARGLGNVSEQMDHHIPLHDKREKDDQCTMKSLGSLQM